MAGLGAFQCSPQECMIWPFPRGRGLGGARQDVVVSCNPVTANDYSPQDPGRDGSRRSATAPIRSCAGQPCVCTPGGWTPSQCARIAIPPRWSTLTRSRWAVSGAPHVSAEFEWQMHVTLMTRICTTMNEQSGQCIWIIKNALPYLQRSAQKISAPLRFAGLKTMTKHAETRQRTAKPHQNMPAPHTAQGWPLQQCYECYACNK